MVSLGDWKLSYVGGNASCVSCVHVRAPPTFLVVRDELRIFSVFSHFTNCYFVIVMLAEFYFYYVLWLYMSSAYRAVY